MFQSRPFRRRLLTLGAGFGALCAGAAAIADVALDEEVSLEPGSTAWKSHFAVDMLTKRPDQPRIDFTRPVTYEATYKARVAGLNVGRVFITAKLDEDNYFIDNRVEQSGIASWFSEKKIDSVAMGTLKGGTATALYYRKMEYEDDDYQYVDLVRKDGKARFGLWSDPAYTLGWPVPEAMALDTVDPISALIMLGFTKGAPEKNPCERHVKVFDGKRRWDMITSYDGETELSSRSSKRYEGPALRCKLSQKKVAGYKPEDIAEETPDGYLYLAPVPEKFRTENFSYIPIVMEGSYGIIGAKLEAKEPVITGPDGKTHKLYD